MPQKLFSFYFVAILITLVLLAGLVFAATASDCLTIKLSKQGVPVLPTSVEPAPVRDLRVVFDGLEGTPSFRTNPLPGDEQIIIFSEAALKRLRGFD